MAQTMTAVQIGALSALLHELRPAWVAASVAATLRNRNDGTHPFPALVIAAVRAANGNLIESPGGIFQDGPHWHGGDAATAEAARPAMTIRCPDHSWQPAYQCPSCLGDVKAGDRPEALVGRRLEDLR